MYAWEQGNEFLRHKRTHDTRPYINMHKVKFMKINIEPGYDVGTWISDRCDISADFDAGSSDLYRDWSIWDENHSYLQWSHKRFSRLLAQWGFGHKRANTGSIIIGLRLKR